jgi:hypothetical protein
METYSPKARINVIEMSTELIPELKDVSFEELKKFTIEEMDEVQTLLLEKDANNETLDTILREKQANSLMQDAEVPIVIIQILKDFDKQCLSGTTKKFLFIGSLDFHGNKKAEVSAQNCFMLRLTDDLKIDDKDAEGKPKSAVESFFVFGSSPNKKVQDLWEPGYAYDVELKKSANKEGKKDDDGNIIMYDNMRNYRAIGSQFDLMTKALLTMKLTQEYFVNLGVPIDHELMKNVTPGMTFKAMIFEYVVTDISAIQRSERVLKGEKYTWETPDDAPYYPMVKANDGDKPQIVFNINGEIKIKEGLTLVVYSAFRAAELAQYFVQSESLKKIFDNPKFLSEKPKNQADFLAMKLRDKTVRVFGQSTNIDFSAEGDKAFVNLQGMSLIEAPPA